MLFKYESETSCKWIFLWISSCGSATGSIPRNLRLSLMKTISAGMNWHTTIRLFVYEYGTLRIFIIIIIWHLNLYTARPWRSQMSWRIWELHVFSSCTLFWTVIMCSIIVGLHVNAVFIWGLTHVAGNRSSVCWLLHARWGKHCNKTTFVCLLLFHIKITVLGSLFWGLE